MRAVPRGCRARPSLQRRLVCVAACTPRDMALHTNERLKSGESCPKSIHSRFMSSLPPLHHELTRARPYVCLYVSQLASCMGLDRYRTIDRALELVWRRIDPTGFDRAFKRCNRTCHDDVVRQTLDRDMPLTGQALTDIGRLDSRSAGNAAEMLVNDYVTRFGHGPSPVIEDALRSRVYTSYGTACEKSVFDCINRRGIFHVPVVEDNTFYSIPAGRVNDLEWYVGGRVDGCLRDRSAVIEIKNRIYRLSRQIKPHDMIQVQAYTQLLNIDKAFLVECYRQPEGLDLCVMATAKDDVMWRTFILPRLAAFVEVLLRLVASPEAQDSFVTSERKMDLVRFWVDMQLAERTVQLAEQRAEQDTELGREGRGFPVPDAPTMPNHPAPAFV